jgi:hypothetical protein
MHDADDRLTWRQAADDFLSQRLVTNSSDKVTHHRQCNVGLEQGHAHFAQSILDVVFTDASFAAQRFEDTGKPRRQVIEHEWGGIL